MARIDLRWMSDVASVVVVMLVMLVSGETFNLIPYYLAANEKNGITPLVQEILKWSVLFSFYFSGIISGLCLEYNHFKDALIVLWLIIPPFGHLLLIFYTDLTNLNDLNTLIAIFIMVIISLCKGIVMINSAIGICKKFLKNSGGI